MAASPTGPKSGRNPFSISVDPSDRLMASGEREASPPPPPPPPKRQPKPEKPKRAAAKKTGGSGGGSGRKWLKRLLMWGLTLAIWAGIAVGALVAYYAIDLPDIDKMTASTRRPSVVFQSVDGEVFAAFGDLYGEPLELSDISPFIPQAVMATEDRRFYSHWGFDPIGLARALYANIRAGHAVQGGSTITQQLAKNLFLTPDRNLKRKVQELLMALWLEKRFSKDQILTLYLNRVYLGSGAFGVDAAAKRYFDVSARKADLYQSAVIAGLLKAPSRYSPLNDPEATRRRASDVLDNMVKAGYINQQTAETAQTLGAAQLIRRHAPSGRYFADWVMSRLDSFGEVTGKDIIIKTTLDLGLQRKVEASLAAMMSGPAAKAAAGQGAAVVMSPDGAVRALAGGKDYDESQFNRATQGLRQPGSSFKPFVYLTAMEKGFTPEDEFDDAPIKLGNWSPGNYTGKYLGRITLRRALAESVNTVAVRLVGEVGPGAVIATAKRLGVSSELRNDATLALGTSEVSLLEMTTAYASFANGGQGVAAYAVSQITDPAGKVLYQRTGGGFGQVITPKALTSMHDMMTSVIQDGSGKAAKLDRPAAGKTGTTQDYRDAWFMGFTGDYVAGVWMGNDDYRIEMKKVTGGGLPAQLWKQIMMAAHKGIPAHALQVPPEEPSLGSAIEDVVSGVAQGAADAAKGVGGALDELIKGIFGR